MGMRKLILGNLVGFGNVYRGLSSKDLMLCFGNRMTDINLQVEKNAAYCIGVSDLE